MSKFKLPIASSTSQSGREYTDDNGRALTDAEVLALLNAPHSGEAVALPAPYVGPFGYSKHGDSYRIEDMGTDTRVATCYLQGNAEFVTRMLNGYTRPPITTGSEGVCLFGCACPKHYQPAPVAAPVSEEAHKHTDECWEPGSGCDMARNATRVAIAEDTERLFNAPHSDKVRLTVNIGYGLPLVEVSGATEQEARQNRNLVLTAINSVSSPHSGEAVAWVVQSGAGRSITLNHDAILRLPPGTPLYPNRPITTGSEGKFAAVCGCFVIDSADPMEGPILVRCSKHAPSAPVTTGSENLERKSRAMWLREAADMVDAGQEPWLPDHVVRPAPSAEYEAAVDDVLNRFQVGAPPSAPVSGDAPQPPLSAAQGGVMSPHTVGVAFTMGMPPMSDLVQRLKERIIADAFEAGGIRDSKLAERLILERIEAADHIERLEAFVARVRQAGNEPDYTGAIDQALAELDKGLDAAPNIK